MNCSPCIVNSTAQSAGKLICPAPRPGPARCACVSILGDYNSICPGTTTGMRMHNMCMRTVHACKYDGSRRLLERRSGRAIPFKVFTLVSHCEGKFPFSERSFCSRSSSSLARPLPASCKHSCIHANSNYRAISGPPSDSQILS